MTSLLRERDFGLLWFGQGVSAVGSAVTAIALPLIALVRLDATAFEVGLITAAGTVAWLVIGLPVGVWADRRRRRPLLIGADLGRAVLLASVAVADFAGALTIPYLAGVALLAGALTVLFDVSYPAYLPEVVDRSRLIDANGKLFATQSAAQVGGPSLGGALLQLAGVAAALLVDAVSFLISALTLRAIRTVESPRPQGNRRRLRTELADGLGFTFNHPVVRALLAAGTLANFLLSGYSAVAVVFLYNTVGLAEAAIGGLLAVGAAGATVGSLLAAPLVRRFGDARLMWLSPLVQTACGALIPLTTAGPGVAFFAVGVFGITAAIGVFAVCARAAIQVSVPAQLLSRTMASIQLFGRGAAPLGAMTGGALATIVSPRSALALLLASLILPAVWVLRSPVRRVRSLADLPVPASAGARRRPEQTLIQ